MEHSSPTGDKPLSKAVREQTDWFGPRLQVAFEELDSGEISSFDRHPGLKLQTSFGVFLWWSDRFPSWVHPDDVSLAKRLVPGARVFRRVECENSSDRQLGYARLEYGDQFFRALPIVWLEVEPDGFMIGDRVEIKSDYGKRRPGLATIIAMIWNQHKQRIEYRLKGPTMPLRRMYHAGEMQPVARLSGRM